MAARIGNEEFEEKVLGSEIPVVVDFYSDSCIACKKLAPALSRAEDCLGAQLGFYKVNTNYERELVERYRILSAPTLVVFRDGQETGRRTGAPGQQELMDWLTGHV